MANLNRYAGNLLPFASNSTGTNRTVFGGITQSDDIDDNITSDFLLGWEIVPTSAAPTKQDFNALGYTTSLLVAYLYQKGIPEWEISQEYHIGSRQIGDKAVGSDGFVYSSLIDTNTGNDPVGDLTNWLSDFSLYSIREVTHNITVDADYTLTAVQNFYKRIVITDTNPFLSTGRNIIVNNIEREFELYNNTLQTLTVKTSLGTGIAVSPGGVLKLRCDGTNVVIAENGLGYSQTWQDVTASRALSVVYTNTTGKPIFISIRVSGASVSNDATITVDGVSIGSWALSSTNSKVFTLTAIVPNGSAYRLSTTLSSTIIAWSELR